MTAEVWRQRYTMHYGKEPGTLDLLGAFERLLKNRSYAQYLDMLRLQASGFSPLPDLDRYEPFLRSVGHDMAAAEVAKPATFLRQLFGRSGHLHNYQALHGALVARIMRGRETLSESDMHLLYSTLDRLLRGVSDWRSTARVPAANKQFYQALGAVKIPGLNGVPATLNLVLKDRGAETHGEDYRQLCMIGLAAQELLMCAAAVKNGRKVASVADGVEAGWAFVSLFETDPRSLPLVIREGRSGYEK